MTRHKRFSTLAPNDTACPPVLQTGSGIGLIEVLVVLALSSVVLALLIPALNMAKTAARSCVCKGNQRQLFGAWDQYLTDFDGHFYQGVNHNVDFGGWQGTGPYTAFRALNPYLNLPVRDATERDTRVFQCPGDTGGPDYPGKAYLYFGNSYATNILVNGPMRLPEASWVAEPWKSINGLINPMLAHLTREQIAQPSRILLQGDHNWHLQFEPMSGLCGGAWHGPRHTHNVTFLDGQVRSQRIAKGLYVHDRYSLVPFADLQGTIRSLQQPQVCGCGL